MINNKVWLWHFIIRAITFAFLFNLCAPLYAQTIRVSAAHWPGYTEPDGKGVYLTLIREVYKEYSLTFDVGTFARAKRQFNSDQADILVGIYLEDKSELVEPITPSYHIDTDSPLLAIYRSKAIQISSHGDLEGKTVGWLEEYNFKPFINANVKPYVFKEISHAFVLLEKGRLDAVIDYEHNLVKPEYSAFGRFELASGLKLYVVFKRTEKGVVLSTLFDTVMPQLKITGKLKRLYGKDYERANFSNVDH
ncbi:hypothetical protein DRW07_07800 [Alteromonas sediminis]|uniref:Solute-binding protein family 3/N-terminal domain-containing protein n=1 Tax=Alteromonas sediminis TaxID=2259342 RepID=A0A3N5ZC69_9ALTE|nr:ABC transporter substrate-binding protein [Alteromonas sediminis]RPJ67418.1 hypothetical protein DRW07_07800 [Alteromonas sediminis]